MSGAEDDHVEVEVTARLRIPREALREFARLVAEELRADEPPKPVSPYLTVVEAAELLRMTEGAVRNHLHRGRLRRTGQRGEPVRLSRAECERFLRDGAARMDEEPHRNGWGCLVAGDRMALSATTWREE